MAITVKQLMKEAIDVLWEGRLWWFGFTAISFVITGLLVSFPIGLLVSMLAHPTTSVGYQPAFQKLLVINIALLIAWVIILDGITTLKVLHPYRHPTSHITLQTLRHFIWRDSSYLLFACVWFSGRAIFGLHISLAILFTFTALALPFIEQVFMRCLSGLSFKCACQCTIQLWRSHSPLILSTTTASHVILISSFYLAPYTFYLSFLIGVPLHLAIQRTCNRQLANHEKSSRHHRELEMIK